MSDLGLLSYKYQTMAELARRLRRNILLIKRHYYGLPLPKEDEDIEIGKVIVEFQEISKFLRDVISLSGEDAWPTNWLDEPPLPNALVEQLRKIHKLDRPQYIKALARLEQRLQDIVGLTEKDISLLEEIAYTASVDANSVFRKLMRWE
ncbi:MAG: hypothetical protein K8L91_11995 [Anaerolineae bacterium]|nr:hypothetical protein [Anaerolineae bacterium]